MVLFTQVRPVVSCANNLILKELTQHWCHQMLHLPCNANATHILSPNSSAASPSLDHVSLASLTPLIHKEVCIRAKIQLQGRSHTNPKNVTVEEEDDDYDGFNLGEVGHTHECGGCTCTWARIITTRN